MLITGQGATPAWAGLALGSANKVLMSNGTDCGWSMITNNNIDAAAAIAWSKMANMNTGVMLGRGTAAAGAVEEMALTSDYGVTFTYAANS
jgi:hypothetical protein